MYDQNRYIASWGICQQLYRISLVYFYCALFCSCAKMAKFEPNKGHLREVPLHVRTTPPTAEQKGFFASYSDRWWKVDTLWQPETEKIVGTSRPCINFHSKTEHSCLEADAVYLVGPARRTVLWTLETRRNHYRSPLSDATNAFESSVERKTPAILEKTPQSNTFAWQRSTTCCQGSENIPGNFEMGHPTPPAVLSWHRPFWFLLIPIDDAWSGQTPLSFFRRGQKLDRFVDRVKRRTIFPTRNLEAARKMGKSCG